jgi:hypothetical protein
MCRGNAAACSAAARDKPVHANARAEGARQGASTFSKAYASSAFVRVTHRRFHDTPIRAPRFCSEPCLPSARCQLLSSRALVLRITRPRESSPACASAGQAGAGAWRGGKWSGRRGQLGAVSGCLDLFHKLALEALLHPRHTAVRRAGLEFNVKRNGGTRNVTKNSRSLF